MIYEKFSRYYDIFYRSRNIVDDINFIEEIIGRYLGFKASTILDIGCGTGDHAIELRKRGYKVVGIDISKEMIDIAKSKSREKNIDVEFIVGDVRDFDLGMKFDVAIALYSVMSYMIENKDLLQALRNIRNHLVSKGLFIFDFWHTIGQIRHYRPYAIWKFEENDDTYVKLEISSLDILRNTMNILYEIQYLRRGIPVDVVVEEHRLRLFTIPEIKHYLEESGFEVVRFYKMESGKYSFKELDEDSAEIICIARSK